MIISMVISPLTCIGRLYAAVLHIDNGLYSGMLKMIGIGNRNYC